jgi:hypothetical protein
MGAKYESQKPDGYLSTRNAVYRDREIKQQEHVRKDIEAAKVPEPMNHANSGYGPIKY